MPEEWQALGSSLNLTPSLSTVNEYPLITDETGGLWWDAGMVAVAGERAARTPPAPRVEGSGEVLALIRDGRARTIGELATAMDMARSTVAQRVDHLLAADLVLPRAGAGVDLPAGRGRPPSLLSFNPDSGVVLVAQVGMTGARVAATDLDGTVLAERFDPFPITAGPDAVTSDLRKRLVAILVAAGRPRSDVRGVGIGVPSAIELTTTSAVGTSTTNSWDGYSITDRLHDDFGVPAFVDNDVNLLALGEQRSRWPDTEVVICVKAGSVIGCGTVVRGEIVAGAQGVAGGLGHLPVPGNATRCSCGNIGCLDAVASGRVLAAALRDAGLDVGDARGVAVLARAGIPQAAQAVRDAGRAIGEVLAHAVNLLNPGVIAVWGYLAEAEDPLLAGIRETVYQRSLPAATASVQLVRAQLGDGLAGAAMMVLSRVLAPAAIDQRLSVRAAHNEGPT